jgi:hypothetical protein
VGHESANVSRNDWAQYHTPRSEWNSSLSWAVRLLNAIVRAVIVVCSASLSVLNAQPTIRRSYKSIPTVRYPQPEVVGRYMMSDTPFCPPRQAENSRFSRFSHTGKPCFELVVRANERLTRAF